MASIVTHIVFADKVFGKFFIDKDKRDFMIGTSFPDIRYLGVIERQQTHIENPTLVAIRAEGESFRSGMGLHALVDYVRNNYIDKTSLLERLPSSPLIQLALKLYEDMLMYDKVTEWGPYTDYFNELIPAEKSFNIDDDALRSWHNILQEVIGSRPTEAAIESLLAQLHFKPEQILDVITLIGELKSSLTVSNYINALYDELDVLLINF